MASYLSFLWTCRTVAEYLGKVPWMLALLTRIGDAMILLALDVLFVRRDGGKGRVLGCKLGDSAAVRAPDDDGVAIFRP